MVTVVKLIKKMCFGVYTVRQWWWHSPMHLT